MKRIPVFLIMTFLLLIVVLGCGGSEPAGSIEERGPTHFCLVDPCIGYEVDLAVEPEAETDNVEAENHNNNTATNTRNAVDTQEGPAVEKDSLDNTDYHLGFDFNLFHEIAVNNPDKNVIISTVSIKLALAMAYNGASGEAKEAIARVVQIEGLSLEEVNQKLHDMMTSLEAADTDVQVEIANSVWSHTGISLYKDFIGRCREYYDAEVESLDFFDPASVDIINKWVDEKTHGKIKKIIKSFEGEIYALINALYFKGFWTSQFNEYATREADFHLPNGEVKKVPLMWQKGMFPYYENQDFQAISLPYGDKRMSMYIFLPKPEKNFDVFIASLNAGDWSSWMPDFSIKKGIIELPHMQTGYFVNLRDTLESLGMGPVFSGNALEGMSATPLDIKRILHKTVLEVNEAGTEGAAVTYIGGPTCAPNPEELFEMRVDRPFFLAIRDNLTGELLFMGSIIDPLTNEDQPGL